VGLLVHRHIVLLRLLLLLRKRGLHNLQRLVRLVRLRRLVGLLARVVHVLHIADHLRRHPGVRGLLISHPKLADRWQIKVRWEVHDARLGE